MADELKAGIQSLFINSEFTKDGKMPKAEVEKICIALGMAANEVEVMFGEIDKDAKEVSVQALMDWVFGAGSEEAPEADDKEEDKEESEEEDDVDDELDEPPPPKS